MCWGAEARLDAISASICCLAFILEHPVYAKQQSRIHHRLFTDLILWYCKHSILFWLLYYLHHLNWWDVLSLVCWIDCLLLNFSKKKVSIKCQLMCRENTIVSIKKMDKHPLGIHCGSLRDHKLNKSFCSKIKILIVIQSTKWFYCLFPINNRVLRWHQ